MKNPVWVEENGREVARLNPIRWRVHEKLFPLSRMEMTLTENAPPVGAFVRVEDTVYRVRQQEQASEGEIRLVAEHALVTLEDDLFPVQWDEKGRVVEREFSGTAESILREMLSYQSRWQLSVATEQPAQVQSLSVGAASLLEGVLSLVALLEEYDLSFDFTALPWKLSLRKRQETVTGQVQPGRNLIRAETTFDDSNLCTRVLHPSLPGGHLDSPQAAAFGLRSRVITIPPEKDPMAVAQGYLQRYDHPQLSARVEAVDLSSQTGEALDHFAIGQRVRLLLPEGGERVVEGTVTQLEHPLPTEAPQRVILTLGTEGKSLPKLLSGQVKQLNKTLRQLSRTEAELDKTSTYAKRIDGQYTLLENHVKIELDEVKGRIALCATQRAVDSQGDRLQKAEITLDGAKAEIELKVSRGDIISAINQSPEQIQISASRIVLDGDAVADSLTGSEISCALLDAPAVRALDVTAETLQCAEISCAALTLDGHTLTRKSRTVLTGLNGLTVKKTMIGGVSVVTSVEMVMPTAATLAYLGE